MRHFSIFVLHKLYFFPNNVQLLLDLRFMIKKVCSQKKLNKLQINKYIKRREKKRKNGKEMEQIGWILHTTFLHLEAIHCAECCYALV